MQNVRSRKYSLEHSGCAGMTGTNIFGFALVRIENGILLVDEIEQIRMLGGEVYAHDRMRWEVVMRLGRTWLS